MTNIVIGPALEIGGNTVEMTTKGKIQVTNPKGRIKTLSQDEFKKNLVKNADKINNGEDFEFKKDNKGLKIAAAAVGTALVATAVIYRKEIGKYLKNFSFKKVLKDIKNLFTSKSNKRTMFDAERVSQKTPGIEATETSKETLKIKNKTLAKMANNDAEAFEARVAELKANHRQTQSELNKALGLRKGQEDKLVIVPRSSVIK